MIGLPAQTYIAHKQLRREISEIKEQQSLKLGKFQSQDCIIGNKATWKGIGKAEKQMGKTIKAGLGEKKWWGSSTHFRALRLPDTSCNIKSYETKYHPFAPNELTG